MTDFRPGNYSVRLMEDIDALRATCPPKWMANLQWIGRMIDKGQHFHMPDDGKLVEVSGMPDEMPMLLRPPYPVTVVEYQANGDHDEADPLSYVASSRRIVIAIDDAEIGGLPHRRLLTHGVGHPPENGVWLVPVAYSDQRKAWTPPSTMFFLSYDGMVRQQTTTFPEQAAKLGISMDAERSGMRMSMAALAIEIFDGSTGHLTTHEAYEHMIGCCAADAQAELFAYQQLCIVLGCSNVSTEMAKQDEKLNKARRKSGKRSFFDYHILTIPGSGDGGAAASDRTVRSHLRRGHIRRLQSGKIIWINATLVKGGASGFVSKSYSVEPPK